MDRRTGRIVTALVATGMAAGASAQGADQAPPASPFVTPAAGQSSGIRAVPPLPPRGITVTRGMGMFPTVAEAVAAARAARLPAKTFATAFVDGQVLAIDAAGTTYVVDVLYRTAAPVGSGQGQRPPQ